MTDRERLQEAIMRMTMCALEKEPTRFQRLKETHPKQYEYCLGGGAGARAKQAADGAEPA